ncbi:unnamed protein product [Tilletia controversa]|nr:unnamed protein product [Tilletia controversa]
MIGAAIMNITTTTFFVGGGSIFYTFIALFSYAQVRQGFGLPVTELCARSWTCLTIVFWLNNLMAIAFLIIVLLKTLDPVIDGISRQRTVFVREDHVSRKFDCVDRQEWHQPFIVRWFAQGKEGPSISDGGPRGQHEIRHPCSRTVSDVPCGQPSGASPPSSQCSKRIDEDAEEENDGEGYPLKLIQTGDSAPLSSVPYMDQADLLFSGAFIGEHLIATQHIEYKQETYITATPVEGTAPLEHQTSRDSTSRSKRRLHFLRPHRG